MTKQHKRLRDQKLSVVTPVFNAENYIATFLKRHVTSTENVEFIFVEDKSTDNSLSELKKAQELFQNIKVIENPFNVGPGSSRVQGARQASGEFLAFVDIDDGVSIPDKLSKQIPNMLTHCSRWSYSNFALDGNPKLQRRYKVERLNDVLRNRWVALSSTVIERELFLLYCDAMQENSYSCEDYALWIKLIQGGHFPHFEFNTMMHYCTDGIGLSSNNLRQAMNVLKVYIKSLGLSKGVYNFGIYAAKKVLKHES